MHTAAATQEINASIHPDAVPGLAVGDFCVATVPTQPGAINRTQNRICKVEEITPQYIRLRWPGHHTRYVVSPRDIVSVNPTARLS